MMVEGWGTTSWHRPQLLLQLIKRFLLTLASPCVPLGLHVYELEAEVRLL